MELNYFIRELENGILTLWINREDKLNALNIALLEELRNILKAAKDDPSVKAVIITGKGNKAFAAGADIAEFADFNYDQGKAMSKNGHKLFTRIEKFPKPVLAAVNGYALGGGCELAMACHLRVASENARFGQPEINLGIIPGYGGTQRLPQLIGKSRAMQMLLTGEPIDAQTALHWGLVNAVVAQEELLSYSKELLAKIVSKAPLAVASILKCVHHYYRKDKDGFETEIKEFSKTLETEDFREGTSAFFEKRKPVFKGK